jgi:hypothetical protein
MGPDLLNYPLTPAGTLFLSGPQGRLSQTSAIRIGINAGITLSTRKVSPLRSRSHRRYHAVHLHSGRFSLLASSATTAESFGTLFGRGFSAVSITAGTGGAQLLSAGLTRVERGTFSFTGANLGLAEGASRANIYFQQPPAGLVGGGGSGPQISILPYALAAGRLATYDAQGIRPLNISTEFTSSLDTAAPRTTCVYPAGWPTRTTCG